MEKLEPYQKQEWKCTVDNHLMRTGSHSLWDAVMIAFREYRDACPKTQSEMIETRTKNVFSAEKWIQDFEEKYKENYMNKTYSEPEHELLLYLLPYRLISTELVPYLHKYKTKCEDFLTKQDLEHEVIDKCILLVNYRQKKKNLENQSEQFVNLIGDYFRNYIFNEIDLISFETIQQTMQNMEHQLILITPDERVLFDSKTWGENENKPTETEYQDVILVLAHPDHTYDSVGRLSYTKDGHQKLSRLFHYDDHIVETLRNNNNV